MAKNKPEKWKISQDHWVLISNFMGYAPTPLEEYIDVTWNEIMPVVEKIEATYNDYHGYFGVHISSNSCTIQGTHLRTFGPDPIYAYMYDIALGSKLESTCHCIVQFIGWYNLNIKPM